MRKIIFVKTENTMRFLDGLRSGLEREGIPIRGCFYASGHLYTPHVKVKVIQPASVAHVDGVRCDEAFYFDPEDHMDQRIKNPQNRYSGTPLGYIIKTEAEETIKDEQQRIKQAQALALNSMYGNLNFKSLYPDSFVNYAKADVEATQELYKMWPKHNPSIPTKLQIKDVIFNPPATIVFWSDGTKTVVKAQGGDEFDAEKGLAMAISKKALGNQRAYYHDFLHWLKKYEKQNLGILEMRKCNEVPQGGLFAGAIEETARAFDGLKRTIKEIEKKNSIRKAYDLLVGFYEHGKTTDIGEVIGYLGEALED